MTQLNHGHFQTGHRQTGHRHFDDLHLAVLGFDDCAVRGLRHYVREVVQALELRGESSYVHEDRPARAYIALDGRFTRFPDCDVALLWDEHRGWSAAIEPRSDTDPVVVAHLGQEVVPPPRRVAQWCAHLLRTGQVSEPGRAPRLPDPGDIRGALAAYASRPFRGPSA